MKHLCTIALILVGVLVWVLTCADVATAGTYAESAHGNTDPPPGYGVNRSTATCEDWPGGVCSVGDCAHCHDTFNPTITICLTNELMLFHGLYTSQSDYVCLQCHQSPLASVQVDMPNQYSYSVTRGGAPESCPRSIGASFRFIKEDGAPRNQCDTTDGSAHRLTDIRNYLQGKWGFSDILDEINPCSACHNPHKAKKDRPCSLPSGHADTWDVWGDDNGETMANGGAGGFTGIYQPPYKLGSTPEAPEYEWGDNNETPDYVWLCSDCHWRRDPPGPIYSVRWGLLTSVNFYAEGGHQHGSGHDPGDSPYGDLQEPYLLVANWQDENFVVMCTDCHEPHGSPNYKLLRTCVNGVDGISVTDWNDNPGWTQFCNACHSGGPGAPGHPGGYCQNCHAHDGDEF